MNLRLAAAAALLATALTTPSAMGATVAPDRPCYREGEIARLTGVGFAPGQRVAISVAGQQIGSQNANAAGVVTALISIPQLARSQQTAVISMTQVTNPALTAQATVVETKLFVVTKPAVFGLGRRLRIRAGGFFGAGRVLYAHVRGRKKRNLRIGTVKGPCGKVSATRKVLLKRRDPSGYYIIQFDTVRRYRGLKTTPHVRKAYMIRRFLRLSRASSFSSPVFGAASGHALLSGS